MRWLEEVAIVAVVAVGVAALGWYATSTPQVQVSTSSRQCVRVLPVSAGTCEHLPEKYELVWVR